MQIGSININMAGGGDEIPAELFKILKDDALKCCTQHVRKIGKLSSDQRTGKGQFSFQSQRRTVPKNVQTTIQLPLFCMLVRLCSKSFKLDFSSRWTEIFQIYKLGLEDRGTRYQIANICRIIEKETYKKICFIDCTNAFDSVDHSKLWKILKEMGVPDHHG